MDFRHVAALETRHHFPEIMGGGVALFDCDADGDLDLFCVQSGDLVEPSHSSGHRLFRNRGDGTFDDVTEAAGVGGRGYGMGCASGDFDSDGDVDLYVTQVGANLLYENIGNGSFRDVTDRAGVGGSAWSTSARFVDYDSDGRLDLLVANYVRWSIPTEQQCFYRDGRRDYCHPNTYGAPERSTLYHNLGDGRFEDVTDSSGVGAAVGNGLGLACGDFDGDGRTDLFVANDMTANHLWLQREPGRFQEGALIAGCALSSHGEAESGMGVQAIDVEDDGDLDLFVTHLRGQGHTLFVASKGAFADRTTSLGLSAPSLAATGFGLGFADFDLDGDLDLYVANGHVIIEEPLADSAQPYAQHDQVFERADDGTFAQRLPRGGTAQPLLATGRGAAFGDIDGDGDVDVVVGNRDGAPFLLRNVAERRGGWVMFDVRERDGSTAIGARVKLRCGGGERWRAVDCGYSYCSSSDPRVHFGLGQTAAIDEVSVVWLDGSTSSFGAQTLGAVHVLSR